MTALLTGCSGATHQVPTAAGASAGATTSVVFDYQLGGSYTPESDVALVVRDRTAHPEDGLYSICYINAFQTQPGEQGQWPDHTLLTAGRAPFVDPDWPDEVLLDTSTKRNREAIAGTISPWIEGCAEAGFEAVEFDNLDTFSRSKGALTIDDNLSLASALADIAHTAGLAVGQKNSAEFTTRVRNEAKFDFAVSEECAAYRECAAYTDAYGEAVIDIEYTDTLPRSFAEMCDDEATPHSTILRDRDLVIPGADGYVFETCGRKH